MFRTPIQPATTSSLRIKEGDDIVLDGVLRKVDSLNPTTGILCLSDPLGKLPVLEISGSALERRLDEAFDKAEPVGTKSNPDRGMSPFTRKRLDTEPAE